MKTLVISLAAVLCVTGCKAQDKKETVSIADTVKNKPSVSWRVNKVVDTNGNIIKYDSTWVWLYSSEGKTRQIDVDSVMITFRKQFDRLAPSIFNEGFGAPIWNDSLFYRDFTQSDYFMRRWKNQTFDMENMMKQMDSIRNHFLKEKYPGLAEQKKR